MTINADTYGASVLRPLGVELVTAAPADRYPTVELDDVAARRPTSCWCRASRTRSPTRHVDELRRAFPAADVRRVDGQDLFWWGIRTPGALDRLRPAAPATR